MLFAACCETGIFSRYIDFIYTSIYYYYLLFIFNLFPNVAKRWGVFLTGILVALVFR